jgi:EAL domain-containing protein (putative c-di-GMP-specific phosphodiesterase class I)
VDGNPRSAAIASSIIALCRSLGLQVTVEGVERAGQLGFLAGCGDVSVQGFLVARPVGADEVIDIAGSMRDRMSVLLEAAASALEDPVGRRSRRGAQRH